MKKLSLNEMQGTQGGGDAKTCKSAGSISFYTGAASFVLGIVALAATPFTLGSSLAIGGSLITGIMGVGMGAYTEFGCH